MSINYTNSYIVHISNIKDKNELIKELSEQLKFPDYFGYNWDALYECLTDLSWIQERHIVIVHDFKLNIDIESLNTYLYLLYDANNKWKEKDEHTLEILFHQDGTSKRDY